MSRKDDQKAILESSRRQIEEEKNKRNRYMNDYNLIKDSHAKKAMKNIVKRLDIKIQEMINATNDYQRNII